MRRFLTLLAGMILLSFPESGCSSGTSRHDAMISTKQTLIIIPSNSPVWSNSLTPLKTNNFNPHSNILPTLSPTTTPAPRFTFAPTLDPLACVPPDAGIEYGLVKWVPDGDTIVVDILGRLHTIHYLGIDAPGFIGFTEYRGPNAARFNEKLARNQLVRLVRDGMEKDTSGQLLRYVFVGDLFLNYEMVRQGLAYVVVKKPEIACETTFIQAEEMAKQEVLGLWEATRTPHRTSTPTKTLTAIIVPGSPLPSAPTNQSTLTFTLTPIQTSAPTNQSTLTSTLTPILTSTSTVSPTTTLTPTVTYTISSTPEFTGTSTLTTTVYIHIVDIAYDGELVQETD